MDLKILAQVEDGDSTRPLLIEATPMVQLQKSIDGTKKKRRRGKTKRKIMKPFLKTSWQDRRKNDKSKRCNRFRKIVVAKSRAPFNNNQFLMEIHKPEPENNFQLTQTPSARTRDSSFSIDSEDNYFFSLPEDEEEYLTKEFSSVYEDAQSERLSNMSKNELIQEYLILEAKYDSLIKRNERSKVKGSDEVKEGDETDKDMSVTDKDSMLTDRETISTSNESSTVYPVEPSVSDLLQRLKDQENQIYELKLANEKLLQENEHLRQASQGSTSEDSESDSSSSSDTCSSSSQNNSPPRDLQAETNDLAASQIEVYTNGHNTCTKDEPESDHPLLNGFHSPKE